MSTALNMVQDLRQGCSLQVDRHNNNRYRIIAQETNGTKTAYCFGVPIYAPDGKLTLQEFTCDDHSACFVGSNTKITIVNDILLENSNGYCRISLPEGIITRCPKSITCQGLKISPTFNGIFCRADCKHERQISFRLTTEHNFRETRQNSKCFALMSEEFKPFITVSCIGTVDEHGRMVEPAEIHFEKLSDLEYILTVSPHTPNGSYVWYEINLHEDKLFQDTTVESKHPQENNAFGGIAFIGETEMYGEQWLYTRPDFSKIPEMFSQQIRKVVLHLPQYDSNNTSFSAIGVAARFCSFGSTWEKKIEPTVAFSESTIHDRYQSIDITPIVVDPQAGFLLRPDGMILRAKERKSGSAVVATGDNYYTPQILEINYV
jgi:hypothetical protein